MKSSRSRSRSKSNRNRSNNNSGGNVINRVFDSSGPEGKVRGTPQQIIEKYNQLARDAHLSNDRVAYGELPAARRTLSAAAERSAARD